MRAARDDRREKILDVEDKSRAMFLHPQKTTSLMRALTLANDSMARTHVSESARRIGKKHRDKNGEMLWIVFARDGRSRSCRAVREAGAPLGVWLARAIDTKCYGTAAAIQGLFE